MLSEARENLKRPDSALLTGILIVVVLYFAREAFVPLALAALIAFVLALAANWLERCGMRRTPAALLVIILSLATVAVLGWVLLGQIYSLAGIVAGAPIKCDRQDWIAPPGFGR